MKAVGCVLLIAHGLLAGCQMASGISCASWSMTPVCRRRCAASQIPADSCMHQGLHGWMQTIPGPLSESTAGMKLDPGSCSQAVRPQAISDLVLAAERMRFPTDSKQMQAKPGSCTRCSYISSQPICKVRSSSNG